MKILVILVLSIAIRSALSESPDFSEGDGTTMKPKSATTKKSKTTEESSETEKAAEAADDGDTTTTAKTAVKTATNKTNTKSDDKTAKDSDKKPKQISKKSSEDDCITSPIDAITSFSNKSQDMKTFVASTKYYWIIKKDSISEAGLISNLLPGMKTLKMAVGIRMSPEGKWNETVLFHTFENSVAKFKTYDVATKKWSDGLEFMSLFAKKLGIKSDKEQLKKSKVLMYYFSLDGFPTIVLKIGNEKYANRWIDGSNGGWKPVPADQSSLVNLLDKKDIESLYIPDPTEKDLKYMIISDNQYSSCKFAKGSDQNASSMAEKCETAKEDLDSLLPCLSSEAANNGKENKKMMLIYIVIGVVIVAVVLMIVVCFVYCKYVRKTPKPTAVDKSSSDKDKKVSKGNTTAAKPPSVSAPSSKSGTPSADGSQKDNGGKDNPDIARLEAEMKQALGGKGSKKSAQAPQAEEAPEEAAGSVKSDQNTYHVGAGKKGAQKKASAKPGGSGSKKGQTKGPKDSQYQKNVENFTEMVKDKPTKSNQKAEAKATKLQTPSEGGQTNVEQPQDLSNFMQAQGGKSSQAKSSVKSKTEDDKVKQLLSMKSNASDNTSDKGSDTKYKELLKD